MSSETVPFRLEASDLFLGKRVSPSDVVKASEEAPVVSSLMVALDSAEYKDPVVVAVYDPASSRSIVGSLSAIVVGFVENVLDCEFQVTVSVSSDRVSRYDILKVPEVNVSVTVESEASMLNAPAVDSLKTLSFTKVPPRLIPSTVTNSDVTSDTETESSCDTVDPSTVSFR